MADTPIIIKKKKSHGEHGHHGGSWKVAYADFVTAMMAFFMVMWIMGLSDETRAQIQGYFNDPLGFMKNQPKVKMSISPPGSPNAGKGPGKGNGNDPSSDDEQSLRKLAQKIQHSAESSGAADADFRELLKHVEVTLTTEGLKIELVESTVATFFASGRADILPSAMHFIRRIGPLLAATGRPIVVEGHTDAMPYPSDSYNNWDLSADRANSMRRALQQFGVPGKQFVQVRAFADTDLKNPSKPFDVSNRRVSLLLPFNKPKDSKVDLPRDEFENRIKVARPPEVTVDPKGS